VGVGVGGGVCDGRGVGDAVWLGDKVGLPEPDGEGLSEGLAEGLGVMEELGDTDAVWKAAISRQVNSQACVWSFIAQGTKPPPNMQCRYGFRKTA
jgi:hypothetical protein